MMRLYDAVPEIDFTWATITPGDVDPRVGNLEMARISFENSRNTCRMRCAIRPGAGVHRDARGDRRRLAQGASHLVGDQLHDRPLQHDAEMTEAHILMAKAGCPVFVLPMPQMGTTGPMSVLGTCILNMAELLSAVVLFQLAAPGAPWSARGLGRSGDAQRTVPVGRPRTVSSTWRASR